MFFRYVFWRESEPVLATIFRSFGQKQPISICQVYKSINNQRQEIDITFLISKSELNTWYACIPQYIPFVMECPLPREPQPLRLFWFLLITLSNEAVLILFTAFFSLISHHCGNVCEIMFAKTPPYPIRFCHAEFEEAKTRSCDKLGTKSITTILHFFIPGL